MDREVQAVEQVAPLLVSTEELARRLGVSPFTIRDWCRNRKIASHKLGTRLLVPREEIDRLLAESLRPRHTEVR